MGECVQTIVSNGPDETFALGGTIGRGLKGREVILLRGGLGAGKTLLTKGIVQALGFDVDEVTSPSFALVNLYRTPKRSIYHIDLWRIDEKSDAAFAVGLNEILEEQNAVTIIEWSERLGVFRIDAPVIAIDIEGDGDDARSITIRTAEQTEANAV